jgi:hypothetical protein
MGFIRILFTINNPCEDVRTLFENGLALASTKDRKNVEAILQQASETPSGPRNYPDTSAVISTSTGHVIRYPRPPMAGVGWGDFDAAEKWQAAGLQITKRMIPNKQWKKKPPNS